MASESQSASFEAVWNTIRQWPAEERRSLATTIMASLAADQAAAVAKAHPADLIGTWRDAGPIDDAAAQSALEEELLRKHG